MSSSSANLNVSKLYRLQVGMSQEEVYEIMRYPMKEDQITTQDGCYDIWFYVTKSTVLGQSEEVPRNLTPLVFKDGVFVGMGHDYYNWLVRKTKVPAAASVPAKPEEENIDLEKSLAPPESAPSTTPGPVQKKSAPSKTPAPANTLPDQPVKKKMAPSGSTPAPAAPLNPIGPPPKKDPGTKVPSQSVNPKSPVGTQQSPGKIKKERKKALSMSSKPKQVAPAETAPSEEKEKDSSEIKMDEEDRDMLEQQQEQDFNNW